MKLYNDKEQVYSGFGLLSRLAIYNLEHYIEEVTQNIWGDNFETARKHKGIQFWSFKMVKEWIKSLSFLINNMENILENFEKECIDGFTFMKLQEKQWIETIGLDFLQFYLLETIILGWKFNSRDIESMKVITKDIVRPKVEESSIYLGEFDEEIFKKLSKADIECSKSGIGYMYGQFVVLGYKEYRTLEQTWTPFGTANEKFILKRKKIPKDFEIAFTNDILTEKARKSILFEGNERIVFKNAHNNSKLSIDYHKDCTRDVYQIGRASHSTNDFIISGQLHVDEFGNETGPVSRYACRIECERLSPYRSFIFAGGFNNEKEIIVTREVYDSNDNIDGFTSFGIKIWQPERQEWVEVSVFGNIYEVRDNCDVNVQQRKKAEFTNLVTDGTLIDICGITLMFQDPIRMVSSKNVNPHEVIKSINDLKPHCPVLLNEIKFTYMDSKQRAIRTLINGSNSRMALAHGPIHIPTTDYGDVMEENRSYVFPACGHIYGYHRSLENRPCSLCRKAGPFVPIAFAFEPSICNKKPTHVFNPCGHVASRQVCEFWSNLSVYTRNISSNSKANICPYCATELVPVRSNDSRCYSRLILQTESGQWIDDDEYIVTNKSGGEKDIQILKESQQELFNRENLASMTDTHPNSYKYKILHPKYLISLEKST